MLGGTAEQTHLRHLEPSRPEHQRPVADSRRLDRRDESVQCRRQLTGRNLGIQHPLRVVRAARRAGAPAGPAPAQLGESLRRRHEASGASVAAARRKQAVRIGQEQQRVRATVGAADGAGNGAVIVGDDRHRPVQKAAQSVGERSAESPRQFPIVDHQTARLRVFAREPARRGQQPVPGSPALSPTARIELLHAIRQPRAFAPLPAHQQLHGVVALAVPGSRADHGIQGAADLFGGGHRHGASNPQPQLQEPRTVGPSQHVEPESGDSPALAGERHPIGERPEHRQIIGKLRGGHGVRAALLLRLTHRLGELQRDRPGRQAARPPSSRERGIDHQRRLRQGLERERIERRVMVDDEHVDAAPGRFPRLRRSDRAVHADHERRTGVASLPHPAVRHAVASARRNPPSHPRACPAKQLDHDRRRGDAVHVRVAVHEHLPARAAADTLHRGPHAVDANRRQRAAPEKRIHLRRRRDAAPYQHRRQERIQLVPAGQRANRGGLGPRQRPAAGGVPVHAAPPRSAVCSGR